MIYIRKAEGLSAVKLFERRINSGSTYERSRQRLVNQLRNLRNEGESLFASLVIERICSCR